MSPTLVTIPFSHFCEKARWSLDAAGIAHREEGHVPVLHRRAVRRAKGRTSVPVLLLDDGSALDDSPAIVRFADAHAPDHRKLLPPDGPARDEALAYERRLDVELAPHVRRFVYFHVLGSRALALRLFERQTPRFEHRVAAAVFPLLRGVMRRFMSIDEDRALESRDRVRRAFDEVGARIGGREYLVGDRFGAVDIAFAAFAAPMVMPDEHPVMSPKDASDPRVPQALQDEVRALRETPAGRFALRVYRDHRRREG